MCLPRELRETTDREPAGACAVRRQPGGTAARTDLRHQALVRRRQDTGLRRLRGPRPGLGGRGEDRGLSERAVPGGRPAARRRPARRQAPVDPGGAAAPRRHRRYPAAGHRQRRPAPGPDPGPADRRARRARRQQPGDPGRRAAGVRRLRRQGARARLGRLQGRGPEGQDRGGADQRPRFRDRQGRVRRQGHDLLRPLDLQVRGRRTAGRGRRADRARDRTGVLRLGHRRQLQHQQHVRRGPRRSQVGAPGAGGLDPARSGGGPVQARRAGFRCAEEAGAIARLQAGGAEGRAPVRRLRGEVGGDHLAQRGRAPARQDPAGRHPHLHRALGSPGRGRTRRQGRPHLQRRAGQRQRRRRAAGTGPRLRQGPGAAALGGVHGGHGRGKGPARLGVLRLQAAVSAGAHGGGDQHGRHEPVRALARFRHLRHRQAGTARRPQARGQGLGPALHA
ncbi:hypothetical protein NB713_003824 [Xanthomonas sacchari]|nr:hypothetical protein [Xanthomonas sacchari]